VGKRARSGSKSLRRGRGKKTYCYVRVVRPETATSTAHLELYQMHHTLRGEKGRSIEEVLHVILKEGRHEVCTENARPLSYAKRAKSDAATISP